QAGKDVDSKNVKGLFGGREKSVSPFTPSPVRYANGEIRLSFTDLESDGFGFPWGQTRTWSNMAGYANGSYNGVGTVISEMPVLLETDTGVIELSNANTVRYFDLVSSVYVPHYFT